MDASGPHTSESQPTQILENAIWKAKSHQDVKDAPSDHAPSKDIFDPALTPSAPQYQLYGVAVTQTQTQYDSHHSYDDPITTAKDALTRPRSPRLVSSSPTPEDIPESHPLYASSILPAQTASRISTKLVPPAETSDALRSKTKAGRSTSTRANISLTRQASSRPRSVSSASEDSFIGPTRFEDPEKEFFATNIKFGLPLSELGREEHDSESYSAHGVPGSSSIAPTPTGRKGGRSPTSVLAEATPSITNPSQSPLLQGYPLLVSQDPETQAYRQSNEKYPSQASNVQAATQESTPPLIPTNPASYEDLPRTQPNELQATQLAGSEDMVRASTEEPSSARPEDTHHRSTFTPSDTSASTNTRSILSMVNPEKRWRFQGVQPSYPPHAETRVVERVETQVQESSFTETQVTVDPSVRSSERPAHILLAEQILKANDNTNTNNGLMHTNITALLEPQQETDDEIVPDSEPTHERRSSAGRRSGEPRTEASDDSVPDILAIQRREEEEEEDESEEDDDVPLAAVTHRQPVLAQAKKRVPHQTNKLLTAVHNKSKLSTKPANAKCKAKQTGEQRKTPEEVPSSAPEQDLPRQQALSKTVQASYLNARPRKSTRGNKTSPNYRVTARHGHSVLLGSSPLTPMSEVDDEDPLDLLSAWREEEEETEPADDADMDFEEDSSVAPPPSQARKRKRTTSAIQAKAPSRVSTRTGKTPSFTPVTRPTKRLKVQSSAGHSSRISASSNATRVFALWKSDMHYYSGTVHSVSDSSPSRFLIHFDDETKEIVDVASLRRCDPKVGDKVIVIEGPLKLKGCIVDVNLPQGDMVAVEVELAEEKQRLNVPVKGLKIPNKTVQSHWKDRTLTCDDVHPLVRPKLLKNSSSASKTSVFSTMSNRSQPLEKTGVVVTFTTNCPNLTALQRETLQDIETSGGTVLDNWFLLFPIIGKLEASRRWVATREDFRYKPKDGVERVFLLSNDANQKPKFLIALALGIPCVSIDWLKVLEVNEKWQSHLLAAGFCEGLATRFSQLVDFDWGDSTEHLTEIMSSHVPSKLFSDKSILIIGAEYVPPASKAKKATPDSEMSKEATHSVPAIILAMGAARVEAVPDMKFASKTAFDYIIVKDLSDCPKKAKGSIPYVPFPWVKDCLIAGRILPFPSLD